jgi:hypothetical protein
MNTIFDVCSWSTWTISTIAVLTKDSIKGAQHQYGSIQERAASIGGRCLVA